MSSHLYQKPELAVSPLIASNTAAQMNAAGAAPRIDNSQAAASPWAQHAAPAPAPPPLPSFMQQPAAAPEAAGPNMAIPGAAAVAASGVPPWVMQMLYGGYAG